MMGRKLPSSFGEEPSGLLTQVLPKGVSLARLHGPHNTLLIRLEPTQATSIL